MNQNIKLVKQALAYFGHCQDLLGSVGPTEPLISGIQSTCIARRLLAIVAEWRLPIGMCQGFMERKKTIVQGPFL